MLMPVRLVPRSAATVFGAGGVVVALVWLYDIVGVAMAYRGGPIDARILQAAILGGLGCLFLYGRFGLLAGPRLTLLAWPALFLGLAWLYLSDAYDPPTGARKLNVSFGIWWADGFLFLALGAVPLVTLFVLPKGRRMLWSDGTDAPTIVLTGRRRRDRRPRNFDELLAQMERQRTGARTPVSATVRARQAYSVALHAVVVGTALWLGIASFGWLSR
jgi:hypothetical protein